MRKTSQNKDLQEYASWLIKTKEFGCKFFDISKFIRGMIERKLNRYLSAPLPNQTIQKIILMAGGSKYKNSQDVTLWNVRPKFDLWPTVLLPSRKCKSILRREFYSRVRFPEIDKMARDLFDSLNGESNE
jgi:hypothetical protein